MNDLDWQYAEMPSALEDTKDVVVVMPEGWYLADTVPQTNAVVHKEDGTFSYVESINGVRLIFRQTA